MALLRPMRTASLAPMPMPPTSAITMDRMSTPSLFPRDDDLIELLSSHEFDIKLKTLTRLALLAKKDPGWFATFARKGDLFKQLERALQDDRWEIQHQCIKFLHEALPSFGSNVEWCLSYLMPNIVDKLGSAKVTVRRVAAQMLATYIKLRPVAANSVQKMIFDYATRRALDGRVRRDLLNELPNLFVVDGEHGDWSTTVDGLTRILTIATEDERAHIMAVLQKLSVFVSPSTFEKMLKALPANQRTAYANNMHLLRNASIDGGEIPTGGGECDVPQRKLSIPGEIRYRYGIVPIHISNLLNNDVESAARIAGLEKLKTIIETVSPEDIARLVPHLHSYFVSLGNVLDDLNFKVVVLALDLVRISVTQLKNVVDAHVQQIVSIISKHFGNQKAVIKQLIMMTCMDLMKNIQPKNVIPYLCVYLDHRNSRVREEILNIMTATLMTFTNAKLNLSALSNVLAPMLIDPKRRVRLAAFEQLSVLAYVMNGRLETLMQCIRDVEQKNRAFGLLNAVHARLRRHQLPRVRYDGLIEYSMPPSHFLDASMNNSVGGGLAAAESLAVPNIAGAAALDDENLDFEWIMRANVGPGSAFTRSISIPAGNTIYAGLPMRSHEVTIKPQQTLSVEKKLPWESDIDDETASSPRTIENRAITRMNSDDHIVRQTDKTRTVAGALRPTPNASTNSWHSPLDRTRSGQIEHRARAPIPHCRQYPPSIKTMIPFQHLQRFNMRDRRTATSHQPFPRYRKSPRLISSLNLNPREDFQPPREVNNNELPLKSRTAQQPPAAKAKWTAVSRARSDGNLIDDDENQENAVCTITNYDDMPIRPAKDGQYDDAMSNQPSAHRVVSIKRKSLSNSNVSAPAIHNSVKSQKSIPGVAGKKLNGDVKSKTNKAKQQQPPSATTAKGGGKNGAEELNQKRPTFTAAQLQRPEQIVTSALQKMDSEEWTDKVDGIQMIVELAKLSPNAIVDCLHSVCIVLLNECKNLRSTVSRLAIGCLGTLFGLLRTRMDAEVEKVCLVLMQKSGDVSSAFIREDAIESLEQMVQYASIAKVLPSLIAAGARSKTNTIRIGCSQLICKLIERHGAQLILNNKEAFEKMISQLLIFSKDQQPAVRYHGKLGVSMLNKDPNAFDRSARKHLGEPEQRALNELLDNIKKKGLGSDGGTILDASITSSGLTRSGSLRKSAGSGAQPLRKLPDSLQLDLDEIRADLNATNWERRIEGLKRFDRMCTTSAKAVASDTKLIEAFIARLNDINGKVALEALETHVLTLPQLGKFYATESGLRAVLSQMATALMAQLASKQEDVRQLAIAAIEETIKHVDIHESLFRAKPKQVEINAVPILWDLLKSPAQNLSDADVRQAVVAYARGLAAAFGRRQLLDWAAAAVNPDQKQSLEAMIA